MTFQHREENIAESDANFTTNVNRSVCVCVCVCVCVFCGKILLKNFDKTATFTRNLSGLNQNQPKFENGTSGIEI